MATTEATARPNLTLQLHDLARPQHQSQRDSSDHNLAERSHDEWPDSLFLHLLKIDAKTHARERKQKRPAGQIRQAVYLVLIKDAQAGQQRDQQKSQDKLGKLLPQKRRLV